MFRGFLQRCTNKPLQWFARLPWTLGRKIQLILLLLVLIVLLNMLASIILLLNLKNVGQQQIEANFYVENAENINRNLTSQIEVYNDAIIISQRSSINDTFSPRLTAALLQFSKVDFKDTVAGKRMRSYLNELLSLNPKIGDVLLQINGLVANKQFREARELWLRNSNLIEQAKNLTAELKMESLAEQTLLNRQAEATLDTTITMVIILAVCTLITLVLIAMFLTVALGGAMRQLKGDLNRVASGEIGVQLTTIHRDEIGEVVNITNRAFQLLRHVIASSAVGKEVTELAENLAATSSQQSSMAQQQASAIAQISTSLEELAYTIQHILTKSAGVAQAASAVLSEAEEVHERAGEVDASTQLVEEAVQYSSEVANRLQSRTEILTQRLQDLTRQSAQIAEITKFIEEVASHTHILAINAAIEAAGAGTYGERFRVIAQEVKHLAYQVTGNTEKIKHLLVMTNNDIQISALEASSMLEEMAQLHQAEGNVNQGVETLALNARRAAQKAERIVIMAQDSANLTWQIEQAIKQHELASVQVVQSLGEIRNTTEMTNVSSYNLAFDSNRLERLSQQLNAALSKVTLVAEK